MDARSGMIRRIIIISLFLILDLVLGVYWLRLQRDEVLIPVKNFLTQLNPSLPETILGSQLSEVVPTELPSKEPFTQEEVVAALQTERDKRKLPQLEYSSELSAGGSEIIKAIIANDGTFEGVDTSKILSSYLQKRGMKNVALYHDTLVGPQTMSQLQKYWQSDEEHLGTVASPDLTMLGVATGSAQLGTENQGIVVIIYAKPQATVQQASVPATQPTKVTFPEISNLSVLQALNQYRADHQVHALQENALLCQYAEKRVQDLVAFGGLDNHEGFRKDFADPEKIPQPIKDYPGGAIGENLAYQNCRNMQTGEGFMAETATALIEWCFDSSTKGHREAQLNPKYNNVCARHQDGYFVIIFGE